MLCIYSGDSFNFQIVPIIATPTLNLIISGVSCFCCHITSPSSSSGLGAAKRALGYFHIGSAEWDVCGPKITQSPSGKLRNPEGVSKVGPVSVCDVWPCVDVVTGIV